MSERGNCIHCGAPEGLHQAETMACPASGQDQTGRMPEEWGPRSYGQPTIPYPISADDLAALKRLGELMLTQDCRGTAEPIYVVYQKEEVVAHPDYDHDRIDYSCPKCENEGDRSVFATEDEYKKHYSEDHFEDAAKICKECGEFADAVDLECEKCEKETLEVHQDEIPEAVTYAVKEVNRFETMCFTEEGAKEYIANNAHNLRKPYIYGESAGRNRELHLLMRIALLATGKAVGNEQASNNYYRALPKARGKAKA